jgi:hypothetical protein
VSLFVLNPEIEDRDEVEVDKWANHKKTFYSEYCYTILLYYFTPKLVTKKNRPELVYFFPAVTLILQFSHFKALVIPTSFVIH